MTSHYSDAFDQMDHLIMNASWGRAVILARNGPVQIVYSAAGVEILAPGEAIENGQFGDLIQMRNSASSQILRGFVSTQNKIEVIAKLK